MAADDFLRRWSRRKLEQTREHAPGSRPEPRDGAPAPQAGPPARGSASRPDTANEKPLPPVESLTPDSDFRDFMHGQVDPKLRNDALKKLFADPRFNVIDELDIDIDDYSKLEKIPDAVAKTLEHARRALSGGDSAGASDTQAAAEPGATVSAEHAPPATPGTMQPHAENGDAAAASNQEERAPDGDPGQDPKAV